MPSKFLLLPLFTVLLLASCTKEKGCTDIDAANFDVTAEKDDGSCVYSGQVIFWSNGNGGCGILSVWVNGVFMGEITHYFEAGRPRYCTGDGCVTLSLRPGTYTYKVSGSDEESCLKTGTFKIKEYECTKVQLYYR